MRWLAVLLVCVVASSPAWAAKPPKEQLVDQVRRAIDDSVQFLRKKENGDGHWEHDGGGRRGGATALAVLALLNAGVRPDDPVVQRGLDYLRKINPVDTYVVGLQTMVFAEARQEKDKELIERNVKWLIDARVMVNGQLRGWSYNKGTGSTADNSNTQYALLGLLAGKQAGVAIKREVWESIRDFYIKTQSSEGAWGYAPHNAGGSLTMTTAGLCGILIAALELNENREILEKDGTFSNCGRYDENQAATKAIGWIGNRFQIENRSYVFYNLYGIERAGRLSGQRFFGEHDWYRRGCEYLVRIQKDDGSWSIAGQGSDSWPVVSTGFAVLFLTKGRTPVLVSKLAYYSKGPDGGRIEDWNNDRHDVRNLTDYCSRELFKREPLAWQIFDPRKLDLEGEQKMLELVGDLLQSPILYFNGHYAPNLRGRDKDMLRKYIDEGGFILAEACCGRKEFDAGFRALMKEMFPDTPLTPLPREHPLWSAHALVPPGSFGLEGIQQGCKTVVVYSPQDLSCLWEANKDDSGRGQLAFRTGGNIVAYATGMEKPKPRGFKVDLQSDKEEKKVPRNYLKVAQLRHQGDWKPAPRAMRNLMQHLRDKNRLDVALQTEEMQLRQRDLFKYKFMYLHGRSDPQFEDDEIANLRANLKSGAVLLADACCGKAAFDKAFRALVEKLFDKKLEPIPLDDDLFGRELNGTAIATVRCRREGKDGKPEKEYRDAPPQLEGIKIDGRWAIIYSKYDIGCALEKHASSDCLGHDYDSALRLASAVVLYSLR